MYAHGREHHAPTFLVVGQAFMPDIFPYRAKLPDLLSKNRTIHIFQQTGMKKRDTK